MKQFLFICLILLAFNSYSQKITRGPDIGEVYFLGLTYSGEGLYYSTNFGETAVCADSTLFAISISADKTKGGIYYQTLPVNLYYSDNYGYQNSWVFKQGDISEVINSGRNDGAIYNHIISHSENYGSNFINHSINGYFGNLIASEIDSEYPFGYAIVYKSSVTDSIFLLISQDNYENIELQNSFYVNYYSKADITRGCNYGELYIDLAQDGYSENLLLRSNNYGQTFDTIESFNLLNFYQLDFEGGRQEGEIYILFNFIKWMWNAHTYIFHSLDYGKTFEVFHPFAKGNEPVLANFSSDTTEGEMPFTVDFCNFSIGDIQQYEWDFDNDGMVDSYEQSPICTYQDTGYYSVKLKVTGPDSSNTFLKENYIYVYKTVGIDKYSQNEIKYYPNPFTNQIIFEFLSAKNQSKIYIFDIVGQLINSIR